MTTLPEALGIIRRTLEIASLVAGSMSGLFFQPEFHGAVGVEIILFPFGSHVIRSWDAGEQRRSRIGDWII
jgi:hypothetical protein